MKVKCIIVLALVSMAMVCEGNPDGIGDRLIKDDPHRKRGALKRVFNLPDPIPNKRYPRPHALPPQW